MGKNYLPTDSDEAFWLKGPGAAMLGVFAPTITVHSETNPVMVSQFYRFLRGASDDMAIAGWRYVMNLRTGAIKRSASIVT